MRLPLTLEVRRSRRLTAALVITHLLAAGGLGPTGLPLWTKAAVWLALGVSLAVALRRPIPAALTLRDDGRVTLAYADGASVDCRVHRASTVFPWLVVLILDSGARKVSLSLPVDALDDEGHRRLRAWLKWKASAAA